MSRRSDWNDPLADHLDEMDERTRPSRLARAEKSKDRIHKQGAEALSQHFGVSAQVRDPSFGDDARIIDMPHPSAPGYRVRVAGPHPHTTDYGAIKEWSMRVDPPGVEHYVAGEEVHHEELGVVHPKRIHERVAAVLGRPDVQAKVAGDQSNVVGQLERHSRNSARGGFLTAYEVGGSEAALQQLRPKHMGPQF